MKNKNYPSSLFSTTATIDDRIDETAFYAQLPNGKKLVAFVERKKAHLREQLHLGTTVNVSICPSDFSRARVDGISKCAN